jgi:hypothetical protein
MQPVPRNSRLIICFFAKASKISTKYCLCQYFLVYNYLLFKNRIFLQHVSNFYSSSGNEREQKIILVEKVDTKTVIWHYRHMLIFKYLQKHPMKQLETQLRSSGRSFEVFCKELKN